MSGSTPPDEAYRSAHEPNGDGVWRSADDDPQRECELCQSETTVNREYGMYVCGACSRTYLP